MRMAPCIDAKAKNIYVLVDLFNKETAQIEIIDDGWGMTYDDLCNKYTIIGRNKRLDNPDDKTILGNAVVYLLRQKMKCGYCGENMSGECGTSKQGVRTYYYKCHGRKNLRNGCKQQPYRKEILEKFVLDSIIAELKKPGQMDYIVQGLLALQESQIKANSTLSILEREQKQNESAMENIMNAVERGFYTAAANKRMKELEERQEELEERQEELERLIIIERSKMQVKVTASEIRVYYEEALTKEPQMLINFLIRAIIEIHIYFNNPLQTGPDASQGLSVCDRETTIPAHIQNSYELRRKNIRLTITI